MVDAIITTEDMPSDPCMVVNPNPGPPPSTDLSLKIPQNVPRKWSQLAYAGTQRVPRPIDPEAGSWPLFFLRRNGDERFLKSNCPNNGRLFPTDCRDIPVGEFLTPEGEVIAFELQDPTNFDFEQELIVVENTLNTLTPLQKQIALYWGDGPPTKQWTPIIDRLIDTYGLTPNRAARVLAAAQGAFNDALVVTWYYKFLYDEARPNQYNQQLRTFICTPRFPTYPSGHSVSSGTMEVVLSYFFPPEADRLHQLAEENSISRLYGGVHFPSDLSEGLRLGRQIGRIIVNTLRNQRDRNQVMVDIPFTVDLHANLPPPPYTQVIPFPPRVRACNLPLLPL